MSNEGNGFSLTLAGMPTKPISVVSDLLVFRRTQKAKRRAELRRRRDDAVMEVRLDVNDVHTTRIAQPQGVEQFDPAFAALPVQLAVADDEVTLVLTVAGEQIGNSARVILLVH